MSGPIERIMFKGVLMTASEIAAQHALNVSTVLRRMRIKPRLTDDQIVAPPFGLPRIAGGINRVAASERPMTVGEAAYHLKRAQKVRARHVDHYLGAIKAGDSRDIQHRLKLAADKAEASVMYWSERVRAIREAGAANVEREPIKIPGRRGWVEPEIREAIEQHQAMHDLVRYLNEPGETISLEGVTLIEEE